MRRSTGTVERLNLGRDAALRRPRAANRRRPCQMAGAKQSFEDKFRSQVQPTAAGRLGERGGLIGRVGKASFLEAESFSG